MKNLFKELSSKDLKSTCGVYKIIINKHLYIGSSISLYSRLREHRVDLSKLQHTNKFMQNCFNKYGVNNTSYEILEFCKPEERISKETTWIKALNSDMNFQNPETKELSEISKLKISESLKKAYKLGRTKPGFTPVEVYDLQGNFIKEYTSAKEASEELGLSIHMIQVAASRYYAGRTCGFYRFRYITSTIPVKKFVYTNTNKLVSKFDFTIIEPDGTQVPILMGVKHINNALLSQLFKGNLEFKIVATPKVPLKLRELLETPEEDNQQPSTTGM